MKARIINTSVEVEVIPYFPEGIFAGFTDVSGSLQPGMVVYKTSDLEFIDKPEPLKPTVDWSAFRREVAKDILVVLVRMEEYGTVDPEEVAGLAICYADELIKQLKEQ